MDATQVHGSQPALQQTDDHRLAADLADTAGRVLRALRLALAIEPGALGDAGDATADALIRTILAHARPHDAFLSEHSAADTARLTSDRVWIIDPLDGTREYSDVAGERADWAVHVALTRGGRPVAAAVALPTLDLTLSTAAPPVLPSCPSGRMKILISRTRPPAMAERVAAVLDAELVPMGSAGAKSAAVIRGQAHAYLHAGGQYEWDSCAPVGVALAAGLHASRIDGSACFYNRADVRMPDLLICRPEIAAPLLAAIAASM
jgi:3'(2'), 5'-bisphosphate nucleotidase